MNMYRLEGFYILQSGLRQSGSVIRKVNIFLRILLALPLSFPGTSIFRSYILRVTLLLAGASSDILASTGFLEGNVPLPFAGWLPS